jgi:uncharacterized protein YbjT (DUF2867 family)
MIGWSMSMYAITGITGRVGGEFARTLLAVALLGVVAATAVKMLT